MTKKTTISIWYYIIAIFTIINLLFWIRNQAPYRDGCGGNVDHCINIGLSGLFATIFFLAGIFSLFSKRIRKSSLLLIVAISLINLGYAALIWFTFPR